MAKVERFDNLKDALECARKSGQITILDPKQDGKKIQRIYPWGAWDIIGTSRSDKRH